MKIKRQDIVSVARTWINTPYHHQASLKNVGCDCIGLLIGVWKELIGELPTEPPIYSPQWHLHQKESQLIKVLKETYGFVEITSSYPPAGSVLCMGLERGPAHHAGISTGEGTFVHSYSLSKKVVEVTLDSSWKKRLHAVLDYPEVCGG
jgi:NlpC/P60 family putative phage cell wall peptidase